MAVTFIGYTTSHISCWKRHLMILKPPRTQYKLSLSRSFIEGVKHTNIACDSCNSQGISGMRYKCLVCVDFDLCYICYHGDEHDTSHRFKRFDTASSTGLALTTLYWLFFSPSTNFRVELPTRQNARKCVLRGIFVDAKVVRGYNWEWSNQDGGDGTKCMDTKISWMTIPMLSGKIGKVVDIRGWDTESARSVAKVHWFSGKTNVYRLAHKGICDIHYIEPSSGGNYYPDHLPILGRNGSISIWKYFTFLYFRPKSGCSSPKASPEACPIAFWTWWQSSSLCYRRAAQRNATRTWRLESENGRCNSQRLLIEVQSNNYLIWV